MRVILEEEQRRKKRKAYHDITSSTTKMDILYLLGLTKAGLKKSDVSRHLKTRTYWNISKMMDRMHKAGYLKRISTSVKIYGKNIYLYSLTDRGMRALSYQEAKIERYK